MWVYNGRLYVDNPGENTGLHLYDISWWCDTELNPGANLAWGREMDVKDGNVIRPGSNSTGYRKSDGFSVRCLRDNVRTEDE